MLAAFGLFAALLPSAALSAKEQPAARQPSNQPDQRSETSSTSDRRFHGEVLPLLKETRKVETVLRLLFQEAKETPNETFTPTEPAPAPTPPPTRRTDLPRAFRKDTPGSLDDLKAIEDHVKKVVARVSPSVVAVEVQGGSGSGVVITDDGLVLCAAHVCDSPDLDVLFTFPDGKTAKGKTLGTNHEMDAGLMRITDKGHWSHVDIGDIDRTRLGDWVLALGHPGGFDPQRSMVVRLGRIIRLASDMMQTDCTLIGGDSGGPLFDMHGRVVGIHSRISNSTAANFHVSIGAFQETWDRLAKGDDWGRPVQEVWVGAWGLDHPEGCRLEIVNKNGPGERAGLKVGDVVTKFNGHELKGTESFKQSVTRTKPGQKVTLDIKRDAMELSVQVTVEPRRGFGGGRFGP